jgi:Tol biopolymer transport system component
MTEKFHVKLLRFLLPVWILTACGTNQVVIKPTEQAVIIEPTAISSLVPTSANKSELYPSYLPLVDKPDILSANQMAIAYGFSVFTLNRNKDGFEKLNPQGFGELRSVSWSAEQQSLAMAGIGGTTAIESNIYMTDSNGNGFHPLVPEPMPYLMDAAWSHDGKRLVTWGLDNNTVLYLVNNDGSGLTELELHMQIFGRPQFAPDDASLYFVGANEAAGLFEVGLDGSFIRQVSNMVENTEAFAWSPDGSHLAYIDVDRDKKETKLTVENMDGSEKITAAAFPFAELNANGKTLKVQWTPDGKYILFDIELGFDKYTIIAANADGSGARNLIESARIPSISTDGKWLAYMGVEKKLPPKLLIVDLNSALASQTAVTPIVVAEFPAMRNGFMELDQILWMP